MDLKEIMSVSGHSGLFRFVSQGRNGIIVESFADKKRMFVTTSQKVSSLNDIAIFTDGEEVPLKNVLKNIHEMLAGTDAPDSKSSPDELKKFMEKALPNYDRNRVYVSDIKKLVSWYNTLLSMDMLKFDEEPAEEKSENKNQVAENPEKKETKSVPAEKKTPKKAKK
ncbi:MAG TPA: DUF5606 domain-containing protein [Bacteroidales bacterium]|nr:DUF5606 domain-containing protein [Bacteroidales bacterium]